MPGYLEKLGPDATLGTAFLDLYGEADRLIEELDEMRLGKTQDRSRRDIPDTFLRLGWTCGRGEGKGTHSSTYVSTSEWDEIRMLSRGRHVIPPQGAYTPESVRAFRGREVSADYSFTQRANGIIECRLGQLGIRGRRSGEPVGMTVGGMGETVAGLPERDQERIEIVGTAIVANLSAIESMALGATPEEAFAEAGRPIVAA
jgi:hypothetical protein